MDRLRLEETLGTYKVELPFSAARAVKSQKGSWQFSRPKREIASDATVTPVASQQSDVAGCIMIYYQ